MNSLIPVQRWAKPCSRSSWFSPNWNVIWTSERVTLTMISRANNGQWNGGRVPYGYDYDKEAKSFSINSQEAAVVKKIYLLYDQYRSILYICRYLNQAGIKTRSGNEWSSTTVDKILTNPFYMGHTDTMYTVMVKALRRNPRTAGL